MCSSRRRRLWGSAVIVIMMTLIMYARDVCAQTAPCVPPPQGMVGWWSMDETLTTTMRTTVDLTGVPGFVPLTFPNNGTAQPSVTSVPGRVAGAFNFTGATNSYVSVPNQADLNVGTGDFTIDAWINPAATDGVRVIVDKRSGSSSTPLGYSFYIYQGRLGIQLANGTTWLNISEPGPAMAAGSWNFVAWTVQRSTNTGRLYVNGVLRLTFALGGFAATNLNNPAAFTIGASVGIPSGNQPFRGAIDEVELFHRALAQNEIQRIFQAGPAGKCKTGCDSISMSALDVDCCRRVFSVHNVAGSPITSISFTIGNGTLASIVASTPCNETLPPVGGTSGAITFSPPCNMASIPFDMAITPMSTTNGLITITFTITHANGRVCPVTVRYQCKPLGASFRCDSLSVSPAVYGSLNLDERIFTVLNLAVPQSPICRVMLTLTPQPPFWLGGGPNVGSNRVMVDGVLGPVFTPTLPGRYDMINLTGQPALNSLVFKLGLDRSLGWNGTVQVTVIHCNGDTCRFPYVWRSTNPVKDDSLDVKADPTTGALSGLILRLGSGMLQGHTAYIRLTFDDADVASIFAAGLDIAASDSTADAGQALLAGARIEQHGRSLLVMLPEGGKLPADAELIVNVVVQGSAKASPRCVVAAFDREATLLAQRELFATTSLVPGRIEGRSGTDGTLHVRPDPARDHLTVEYNPGTARQAQLVVVDNLGRQVIAPVAGRTGEGTQVATIDVHMLASGSYFVLLVTDTGGVVAESIRIVR